MFFSTTLASLGLLATTALAAPHRMVTRQTSSGPQNVVYWGQNGGGVAENNDLSTYCTKDAGIDIVVLSFLYQYGNGVTIPGGTIGQSCSIDTKGKPSNCDDLAESISTCKSNGVKVILSLGGAAGSYSLKSQAEAEKIGQNLWDAYGSTKGNSSATAGSVPRPFGDVAVDGWDFDIESNAGNENYQYMIKKLRSNFGSETFYITGAPQCPIPEPNMNEIITKAQFDYLFIQFYNNPGCSVDGPINWDDWKKNVADTPSANAKLFLGVPASKLGATGTESGSKYYLKPDALNSLVSKHKDDSAFGGVMMWAAGFSDANVSNGCTYAQQAKKILTTGKTC
ncbi:Endochitinase 2 [Cladobotryum mycophilum]|uniref:Endochitinase 2 n=1 Tax=Cladobotryum mycophilum TaxID=491253 RepID=A0ABR0SWP5_9HYPO